MDAEKGKFQYAGLKFLYEMELIEDPQLINNLKLNIFNVSSCVRDVEFLSSYNHRAMLIYIDISWIGRKFLLKRIESGILERVTQLLPKFKFRVTADRKIFDLSLEKVKTVLKGDSNEKPSSSGSTIAPAPVQSVGTPSSSELPKEPNILQDPDTKTGD